MNVTRLPEARDGRGFTIIELLVVMSVIAVLLALVVPAIQRARESSRGLDCRNRLKQLGLASHSFHESHQRFPIFGDQMFRLLPFVEQQALHDEMEKYSPFSADIENDPDVPESLSPNVSVYVCPSSQASPSDFEFSYFMNGGTYWTGWDFDRKAQEGRRNGMSSTHWYGGPVRMRHVHDGASNTAFFSEIRRPYDIEPNMNVSSHHSRTPPFYWEISKMPESTEEFGLLSENPPKPASLGNRWIGCRFDSIPRAFYKHIATPNNPPCRVLRDEADPFYLASQIPPSSNHDGGVNVLMVDGSVKFISDDVDRQVWRDLGSRDSRMKEPVTLKEVFP